MKIRKTFLPIKNSTKKVRVDHDTYDKFKDTPIFLVSGYPSFRIAFDYTYEGVHCRGNSDIALHRFVMRAPKGVYVDHKNLNILDCRRKSMRLCTQSQNICNRRKNAQNSSGYKGVKVNRRGTIGESYTAELVARKTKYSGGTYTDKEVAARMYDKLAIVHHGEFARLNFEEDRATAAAYVPPPHTNASRGESKAGYTGVYLNKLTGRFYAQLVRNGSRSTIKTGFKTAKAAASYRRSYLLRTALKR